MSEKLKRQLTDALAELEASEQTRETKTKAASTEVVKVRSETVSALESLGVIPAQEPSEAKFRVLHVDAALLKAMGATPATFEVSVMNAFNKQQPAGQPPRKNATLTQAAPPAAEVEHDEPAEQQKTEAQAKLISIRAAELMKVNPRLGFDACWKTAKAEMDKRK